MRFSLASILLLIGLLNVHLTCRCQTEVYSVRAAWSASRAARLGRPPAMRLPQEALLQILQLLRRWDLALLSIVNRPLESRVSGFASELALRCIDGAWVHGPVPGRKVSMLVDGCRKRTTL